MGRINKNHFSFVKNHVSILKIHNKKALLCYSLCRSLLDSQFQSNFQLIPALYAEFPDFYANIFSSSSAVPVRYVGRFPCIFSVRGHGECARDARTRGVSR